MPEHVVERSRLAVERQPRVLEVALCALRQGIVPGIRTLAEIAPDCAGLRISAQPQEPRSDVALVLSRGFASTNAALLLRAA
jgi:3-oxoacyl-(acyl-carrier-protein) synthase